MKILHIISQTPDHTGSGKFIQEILNHAAVNRHDNFLVAGIQSGFRPAASLIAPENCLFVEFDGQDLVCAIPGMSDAMPYKSTVFSTLSNQEVDEYESVFYDRIQQAIDRFHPDIIHTHHLWIATSIALKAAKDIPVVTTCHGTCLRQFHLCPHIGTRISPSFRKITRIMALSRFQKADIARIHSIDPEKIDVIPGGFNDRIFYPAEKTYKDRVELLYAGKLSRAKGVPWLLAALGNIRNFPFRLHMAGGGSAHEKQLCLDMARGFGSQVIYHGPLTHEQLSDMMRQCHIFVLPSFYEGFPLVLMEALACGCRIITTALEGIKEVLGTIQNDRIQMIDLPPLETIDTPFETDMPHLEASLAQTLERMIQDVVSNKNRDVTPVNDLIEGYTWKKIFDKIQQVYTRALITRSNDPEPKA